MGLPKYSSVGYNRMLWDTFFLDEYLPSDAKPDDLIGIVDSDMGFTAPLVPALFLADDEQAAAVGRPGTGFVDMPVSWDTGPGAPTVRRRLLRVVTALPMDVWYPGGKYLLRDPEGTPYDLMSTDAMPQVFFLRTFGSFRRAAAERSPEGTFVSAWLNVPKLVPVGIKTFISPVNSIFNFAVMHEPQSYAVSLPLEGAWGNTSSEKVGPVIPSIGSNRPHPDAPLLGCCVSYSVRACNATAVLNHWHFTVTYTDNVYSTDVGADRAAAAAAYKLIDAFVANLPNDEFQRRRAACLDYGTRWTNNLDHRRRL